MMTVKELLQLPITKDFSVAAGSQALNNRVQRVEILDFEFAPGIEQVRDTVFNPGSLVLSSLLFASQAPERLIDMMKKLIELKVSALAYKPVIFKELPDNVLTFANEQGFPILRFGGDEFFEDIIMEVMSHIKKKDHSLFLERMMQRSIEEELSESDIQAFLQKINQPFGKYVCAANIQMNGTASIERMPALSRLAPLLEPGMAAPFKNSLFILFTGNHKQLAFEKKVKEQLALCSLPIDSLTIGYSQVHSTHTSLHLSVREAYYARIMAEIGRSPVCHYEQLASDQLLIELYRKDAPFANNYVHTYLGRLLEGKADRDLLDTAVTFVLKKGNVKETAAIQHCHPNTIRYRMMKIRQLIEPLSSELIFYEHLSAAVKLYLLQQAMEEAPAVLESAQK